MFKYLFFITLLIPISIFAQVPLGKSGLQKILQPKVSLESTYISDASISGYDGSLEVEKSKLSISNAIAGFTYTNWAFKWNNIADLPFGDGIHNPIEQMHSFNAYANIPYFINEEWLILTSVSTSSTFEKETTNSYTLSAFSIASYKINKDNAIQFGVFANSHPVTTLILPSLSYTYRVNEKDGFKVILGFPKTYVEYQPSKEMLVRFGVIYAQSVIRLSNTSSLEESGFMETQNYTSNLGISYDINKNFTIETDLLYILKRDYIIYSKNKTQLGEYSIDPSLGIDFKITYLF